MLGFESGVCNACITTIVFFAYAIDYDVIKTMLGFVL